MPTPSDRLALAAGAVLIVFAVSGLLDNSGLLRHDWRWTLGVIVIGLAVAVAARTVHHLVVSPVSDRDTLPSADPEG